MIVLTASEGDTHVGTVLALDLGGTWLRMALMADGGSVLHRHDVPSAVLETPLHMASEVSSVIASLVKQLPGDPPPTGLAAAVAGAVDQEAGYLCSSPNLPGWQDVPLREILERETGLPCLLDNDANAAAWGEMQQGAGQGYRNALYVTMSTGIGGGIIIDGKIYRGSTGAAGEIGHIVIEPSGPLCGCGNRGCLEAMASGTAIARYATEALAKGASSILAQLTTEAPGGVTAEAVGQAAKLGDAVATEIVQKAASYLGIGLAGMVNVLNPQLIIIGGGVSNMGPVLLEPFEQTLRAQAFPQATRNLRIALSTLGNDAGLIGAAELFLAWVKSEPHAPSPDVQ